MMANRKRRTEEIQVSRISLNERPVNINAVSVTVNKHPAMASAPIEIQAGASWASLDIDGARELIHALDAAIVIATEGVAMIADWMRCDARTILDAMSDGTWPVAEWPHEADAKEKLDRLLRVIATNDDEGED